MAYAQGIYTQAICDRCGFQFRLNDLRKEWTGYKVCSECYEPKHPQLEPKRDVTEGIAVRDPRPDRVEPMVVYVGAPGDSSFESVGMQPAPLSKAIIIGIMIGNVGVTT